MAGALLPNALWEFIEPLLPLPPSRPNGTRQRLGTVPLGRRTDVRMANQFRRLRVRYDVVQVDARTSLC
jgi:hypothetical protein